MGQYGFSGNETALGKTQPGDMRRIIRAQYVNADSNPIIDGGDVSGRADQRAYNYTAGVGVLRVGDGAVILTWPAGTTALVSQPSTARTDLVYVDVDGAVKVAAGGAGVNQANVIVLEKPSLAAGVTSTQGMSRTHNKQFAMPYGAQIGWLGTFGEVHAHGTPVSKPRVKVCDIDFWVPTRRDAELTIRQCVFGAAAALRWEIFLNGTLYQTTEIDYDTKLVPKLYTEPLLGLAQGVHRLSFYRWLPSAFVSSPAHFGGGPEKYVNGMIHLLDRGVSRF